MALAVEAEKAHGVSRWHLLREFVRLRKLMQLEWTDYFGFRLFDPNMSWEHKTEFVSARLLRRLWGELNPKEYSFIFKNKLELIGVFKYVLAKLRLQSRQLFADFTDTPLICLR